MFSTQVMILSYPIVQDNSLRKFTCLKNLARPLIARKYLVVFFTKYQFAVNWDFKIIIIIIIIITNNTVK